NAVLNLGPSNANLAGANLDLQFIFDFTSTHPANHIAAQFLVGAPSGAPLGIWTNPNGGQWNFPTNRSANTIPLGPATSATFASAITAPRIVTLEQNTT